MTLSLGNTSPGAVPLVGRLRILPRCIAAAHDRLMQLGHVALQADDPSLLHRRRPRAARTAWTGRR